MPEKKIQYVGMCPVCGEALNYGSSEFEDDQLYYEVSCSCGFEGKEWYSLTFGEITSDEKELPLIWEVTCSCNTVVEVEDGCIGECSNCGTQLDDKGNIV
jgi:predicted RNA-binding Zn-ribbon protein involved in translation (DUF1610 family)